MSRASSTIDLERFLHKLDWNLLRTYVTIVNAGGISKAAEVLRLSQPTLSAALKRLESQVAKKLIDRGPNKFVLTEAGEQLYKEAVEIRGSVLRLSTVLRDVTDVVKGHVRLAIASHVVTPLLDECLRDFHISYPLATMEIEVMASRSIQTRLLERSASIGLCLALVHQEKLRYQNLFTEYFGLFCGRSHPLYGLHGIAKSALKGQPSVSFVTDQMNDALRPVTLMRAELGLSDYLVGSSPNLEEVKRMICAGMGIGPLPLHVAQTDLQSGLLWRLPPYEDLPKVEVNVAWNPEGKLNRAERAFLDLLLQKISETPPELRDYGR